MKELDLLRLLNPEQIQPFIDGLVNRYDPERKYVDYITYVPDDGEVPLDATNRLILDNVAGESIMLAIKAKPLVAAIVGLLLKEL